MMRARLLTVLMLLLPVPTAIAEQASAIFAGGCFWCMEPPYDSEPGVISTTSGYTGGTLRNPSYEKISSGDTGHYEAIEIVYDPDQVSYERLLEIFWINVDPFDSGGQFCDRGPQYRAAIFPRDGAQREAAQESLKRIRDKLDAEQPIAVEIIPAQRFWEAEDYHQNYYEKNPLRYKYYRWSCGRDQRLQEVWPGVAADPE